MKSSKPNKSKATPPATPLSPKLYLIGGIIIAGIIALGILKGRVDQATPTQSPATVASTNASAIPAQAKPDFQKLKGKWLRPDGGYVIEIKSAESDGKLNAGYFNPSPIHVAKAEARQEGNNLKVFIELQDVNYPGSTYTLTYLPDRDLWRGLIFKRSSGRVSKFTSSALNESPSVQIFAVTFPGAIPNMTPLPLTVPREPFNSGKQ